MSSVRWIVSSTLSLAFPDSAAAVKTIVNQVIHVCMHLSVEVLAVRLLGSCFELITMHVHAIYYAELESSYLLRQPLNCIFFTSSKAVDDGARVCVDINWRPVFWPKDGEELARQEILAYAQQVRTVELLRQRVLCTLLIYLSSSLCLFLNLFLFFCSFPY